MTPVIPNVQTERNPAMSSFIAVKDYSGSDRLVSVDHIEQIYSREFHGPDGSPYQVYFIRFASGEELQTSEDFQFVRHLLQYGSFL
jgi:hypothetical protein